MSSGPASRSRPVVFLAFANEQAGRRYLRDLPEEQRRLRAIVQEAVDRGLCELEVRPNATLDEIDQVFTHHGRRLAIFHYAGHAGPEGLLLESSSGAARLAHAEGLARFLGRQGGLQLVVLNGCSTRPQVAELLESGVPAVVATARPIADEVARAFAVTFYTQLAAGRNLRDAFELARERVKAGRGTDPRDFVADMAFAAEEIADDRGFPWDLRTRAGAERVERLSLPELAGDPLFGLPELKTGQWLPPSPYRHLQRFTRTEAAVFFGRGHAIRALYDLATSPSSRPVILYSGPTGVGKSSVLDAGLTPRLETTHEVRYLRRDGLLGLLRTVLHGLSCDPDVRTADLNPLWRAREQATGRPLVVVLDQAEEAFTRPRGPSSAQEVAELVGAVRDLFADPARAPRGKLILGFRKEWLQEFERAHDDVQLGYERMLLAPLDRAGIVEAIEGPTRDADLQRHYGLTVEAGLAERIAVDLEVDAGSALAPTLQVLLTKLWEAAGGKEATFTHALYDRLKDQGFLLKDVLDEGLKSLSAWRTDVVDSGFALDLLEYHTTPLGTAETRTHTQLVDRYSHRTDVLAECVRICETSYLLIPAETKPGAAALETPPPVEFAECEASATRLGHDTLAPLVRERFRTSMAPAQRARRLLENRAPEWKGKESGPVLDRIDLETVEQGRPWMRALEDDEPRLLETSRQAEARRQAEEAERRRQLREAQEREEQVRAEKQRETELRLQQQEDANRQRQEANRRLRRRAGILLAVSVVTVLIAVFAGYQWNKAIEQRNIAKKNEWLSRHEAYASDFNLVEHLPAARVLEILERQKPKAGGEDLREFAWYHLWSLYHGERVITVNTFTEAKQLAFSPDGRILAISEEKSMAVQLWNASTGERIAEVEHEEEITDVKFVLGGKALATSSRDQTVKLWNPDTGQELRTFQYEDPVLRLLVSPDGKTLAALTALPGIPFYSLRDLETGEERKLSNIDKYGEVTSWGFAPHSDTFALGCERGRAVLYDVKKGVIGSVLKSECEWRMALIAFSPDQTTLAMAFDHTTQVRLWDVAREQERLVLEAPNSADNEVLSVQFSPDGRTVALAIGDPSIVAPAQKSAVLVWDAASGRELFRLDEEKTGFVTAMGFAPDGTFIATAGKDHTIRLWDAADGRLRNVLGLHHDRITRLRFSNDGKSLATASSDKTVRIWDMTIPPAYMRVPQDPAHYSAAAFSPNGQILATGSPNGRLVLWNVGKRERIREFPGHAKEIWGLAFSPDGQSLASASTDGVVKVWNVETANQVSTFAGLGGRGEIGTLFLGQKLLIHFARPGGVVYNPGPGKVHVWNRESRERVAEFDKSYNVCACSPDGSLVATIGGYEDGSGHCELTLWDLRTMAPRIIAACDSTHSQLTHAAFSPHGKILAVGGPSLPVGSKDKEVSGVILYDTGNPDIRKTLRFPSDFSVQGSLRSLAFSPDGQMLATVGPHVLDGRPISMATGMAVTLWSVTTGEPLKTLVETNDRVCSGYRAASCARYLRFSPDSRYLSLVVGASVPQAGANEIIMWDLKTGRRTAIHLNDRADNLIFSPVGCLFATTTASRDNAEPVTLWETESGRELGTVGDQQPWIYNLTVTRDDRVLAGVREYSSSQPVAMKIWDLKAGKAVVPVNDRGLSKIGLTTISPDGDRLVTELFQKGVLLWDLNGDHAIATLPGRIPVSDVPTYYGVVHVPNVTFSSDGAIVATFDGDKIIVSDGHTGEELRTVAGRPPIAFSSAGDTLAMIGDGGKVSLWDYRTNRELARLETHGDHTQAIAFSPDGETIITLSRGKARLWNAATGGERTTLKGYDAEAPFGVFSPDGRTLATAGRAGDVDLWDPVNGRRLLTLDGPDRAIVGLAFSTDGRTLIVGHDTEIRMWRSSAESR